MAATGVPPTAPPEPPQQAPPSPPEEKGPSRTDMLFRNRKRLLLALALLVLAVGVAVASTAVFSSSAANPGNIVTSGTLTLTNEGGKVIFTGTNMVPGNVTTGTVKITNTGNVKGAFTLKQSSLTDDQAGTGGGNLSDVLKLTITDLGADGAAGGTGNNTDFNVYGPTAPGDLFKSSPAGGVALPGYPNTNSTWNGGEGHTYEFKVTF